MSSYEGNHLVSLDQIRCRRALLGKGIHRTSLHRPNEEKRSSKRKKVAREEEKR